MSKKLEVFDVIQNDQGVFVLLPHTDDGIFMLYWLDGGSRYKRTGLMNSPYIGMGIGNSNFKLDNDKNYTVIGNLAKHLAKLGRSITGRTYEDIS